MVANNEERIGGNVVDVADTGVNVDADEVVLKVRWGV